MLGESDARPNGEHADEFKEQSAESARAIGEKSILQSLDGSERGGV